MLLLEECKTTSAETIQVSKAVVMKICREALAVGRVPALGFGYADVPHGFPQEWVALPKAVQEVLYRIAEAALGDLDDPAVQEEIKAWTSRI